MGRSYEDSKRGLWDVFEWLGTERMTLVEDKMTHDVAEMTYDDKETWNVFWSFV